jgi:hypothetical protein
LADFLPSLFAAFLDAAVLESYFDSTVGPPDKFVISVLLNLRYSSILFYIPGWLAGGWMCTDGSWCEADEGSERLA